MTAYWSSNASLAQTLDQDNLYGTCCRVDVVHPDILQQTVTAGMTGYLTGILVEIWEPQKDGLITFSLYEGDATPSIGPTFEETIDTSSFETSPFSNVWNEFYWDVSAQNFSVHAGDVFTFGLTSSGVGNGAAFADDVDDQYPGGKLYINGDSLSIVRHEIC